MSSTALPRVVLAALLLTATAGCARGTAEDESWLPSPPSTSEDPSLVTEDEIRDQPGKDIREILSGRIAGVWVTRSPSGGLLIRIRGRTSIRGDDQPLYVLDGIPIEPAPDGSLFGINPYEIESIKVLKGPAETAMYGVRGANGVILIKLKGAEG